MSPKQLLDLPDEVLNFVAEAVDNLNSLHALARTCTRFQDHAEKFIYRSLTIEHGAQAQALHKAIITRPRRATMASKLTIAPSMVATRGIEHIPSMLEKMNCVKDLFIESPFCKKPGCSEFVEDQERYANIFRKSSLHIVDPSARLLSQLVSCKQQLFTSCRFAYAHDILHGLFFSPQPCQVLVVSICWTWTRDCRALSYSLLLIHSARWPFPIDSHRLNYRFSPQASFWCSLP
jgi:hypothetical protein